MQKQFLSFLFILFSFTLTAKAVERCKNLIQEIKKSHYYYFGVDFPFWYSVAQAEKESLCRHSILSSDGIGSEGFAQITFKLWKDKLTREGITEIKSIHNHAKAQAFINKYEYDRTVCLKLFEMYQRYNGGGLVSKELIRAGSCKWEDGYRTCRRKDVCVYRTNNGCKQWRNACDINYSYSIKIYEKGKIYQTSSNDKFNFW